jgi:hypothetical protein
MYCRKGFTAKGEVRLPGARIGRDLTFSRAILNKPPPDGYALFADALTVDRNMYCRLGAC